VRRRLCPPRWTESGNGDRLSIWLWLVLVAAMCALLFLATAYSRSRALLPRMWVGAVVALLYAVVVWFGLAGGIGILAEERSLSSAGLFFVGVLLPAFALMVTTTVAQRFAARHTRPASTLSSLESLFFRFGREPGTENPAPLGKLSAPIEVTSGPQRILIVLPARRTRAKWFRGSLFLAPGLYVIYLMGTALWLGLGLILGGQALAALGILALGLLTSVLRMLPLILVAAWGWHILFGRDEITITATEASLRTVLLGSVGFVFRRLEYSSREPVSVVHRLDSFGRWTVALQVDRGGTARGWNREFEFGGGIVTRVQAEQLCEAVAGWLGGGETPRSSTCEPVLATVAAPVQQGRQPDGQTVD